MGLKVLDSIIGLVQKRANSNKTDKPNGLYIQDVTAVEIIYNSAEPAGKNIMLTLKGKRGHP